MGNAWTRVHRGHKHETAGEGDFSRAARDGDVAVLERLAQHLKRGAFKFRQLVQKKHAVMGEGDFSGSGNGAAPEQTDVGNGVMGRAERRGEPGERAAQRGAGGGMDAQHFKKFVEHGRRQDGGNALGDH